MKRNITIIFVICVMLIGLLILPMNLGAQDEIKRLDRETRGNTLYVGSGQTYSKIQDAVDAANAGDTIRVYSGTYYESLSISKTLSIIGNGSLTTSINGSSYGEAVFINAHWCNMTGFTIIDGLTLTSSDNNVIDDCILELDGIYFDYSDNNRIKNCIANSNIDDGHGIYLFYSNSNIIESCICNWNYMSGIYLKNSNNNIIINSTFNSNDHYGLHLYESHDNIIKKSIFNKNEFYGISCMGSNRNTIVKCISNLNNQNGMIIDGTNNFILENTCNSNVIYGINFGSVSHYNTIAYGNCSGNDIGIYIWGSDYNIIKYNNLFNNINFGIEIHTELADNNLFHHNNFMNNKGSSQTLDHGTNNIWNTDKEGNYWSDWTTPDSDENGIVDIPNNIPGTGNSKDFYPLISPVNITNLRPIPNAGQDQKGIINQILNFNGSGSYDNYEDSLIFKWDFGDGTSTGWQKDCNSSHSYQVIGNYTVKLTVSDHSLTDSDTCVIHIINQAPVANAGSNQNAIINQIVYFDGSMSYDPEGDILTFYWDFGDGNSTGWQSNCNTSHKYNTSGNYSVSLNVSDGVLANLDICIVLVSGTGVNNTPPIANAGSDQNVTVNQTVYFDGSGSYDLDGDPLTYKWNFGDGTSTGWQSNCNSSHAYNVPGNYTATIYVDDGKMTDSDTCIISISNGSSNPTPPPPKDSDGDGFYDSVDAFPFDSTQWYDTDGDGFGDNLAGNNSDLFPMDPTEWSDTDGDGIGDNSDMYPHDPSEWSDADGDGVGDNSDIFPNDPLEWTDADRDGTGDNSDIFPNDPLEWSDIDGDKVGDNSDEFPDDSSEWIDTDGDKIGDNSDAFPTDATEWLDSDGDGVGDNSDADPNDPNIQTISEEQSNSENGIYFMFIIAIIVIILIMIMILLIIRNTSHRKRLSKPFRDDRLLRDLRQQVLHDKPIEKLSPEKIENILEKQYQQGKISDETYGCIKDVIEHQDGKS